VKKESQASSEVKDEIKLEQAAEPEVVEAISEDVA